MNDRNKIRDGRMPQGLYSVFSFWLLCWRWFCFWRCFLFWCCFGPASLFGFCSPVCRWRAWSLIKTIAMQVVSIASWCVESIIWFLTYFFIIRPIFIHPRSLLSGMESGLWFYCKFAFPCRIFSKHVLKLLQDMVICYFCNSCPDQLFLIWLNVSIF